MRFVDSHCHLNFQDFSDDLEGVIQRARDAGVTTILTICTKMTEAEEIIAIADQHEGVYASVGVHPHDSKNALDILSKEDLKNQLLKYAELPKVVGLGESGLDYFYENSSRKDQKKSFSAHIEAAKETELPLIVHTRDAENDTVDMLDKARYQVKGVIHCFSGTQHLADKVLDLGFYISISGIVTFKKSNELREIVKAIPLDKLLLETDAPYLAPVPNRGKRNEPCLMTYTAEVVADLKKISVEELAEATTYNYFQLFSKSK